MTRALIAGVDADEIADLARAARPLLGTSCSYLAVELDLSATDPELAWAQNNPSYGRSTSPTTRPRTRPTEPP